MGSPLFLKLLHQFYWRRKSKCLYRENQVSANRAARNRFWRAIMLLDHLVKKARSLSTLHFFPPTHHRYTTCRRPTVHYLHQQTMGIKQLAKLLSDEAPEVRLFHANCRSRTYWLHSHHDANTCSCLLHPHTTIQPYIPTNQLTDYLPASTNKQTHTQTVHKRSIPIIPPRPQRSNRRFHGNLPIPTRSPTRRTQQPRRNAHQCRGRNHLPHPRTLQSNHSFHDGRH